MRRMRTRTIRQAGSSGGRTSTRRTRRGYFERRRKEEDDGREGVNSKEELLWPISTATSCTPWWTRFPRAMCRRRARFCARWRIQWNWRFWPRPWTTSRRRRKSEPRWRRLWPMHLPTSRLNNSGANRHEASAVPPAGGQGSGTVTKPRPGPGGGGHRAVYPNRLWRRKDADRRGAPTQVARGRLASAFHL